MKEGDIYGVKVDEQGRILCEDFPTENNFIIIEPPLIKYIQDDDLNRENDCQELKIGMDSSGCGYYYYIETQRWAFNEIDDLINILQDYKSRFTIREHD